MLFPKSLLLAVVGLLHATDTAATTASGYQTFNSSFGDYAVRYKSWPADHTRLCNGGSAHHAGWADLGHRHLFFWYHEARHNADSAPLLIWHQGGPGGSSLHGMFFENGPCLSDGPDTTRFNPHSWTEYFNVVFLDQPAGVGFSYVDQSKADDEPADLPTSTPESALDSVAFIRVLYEAFPSLSNVDLHLSGESYAGRYVPSLAAGILDYNAFVAHDNADAVIPLRSILVGNPYVNPAIQMPSMHEVSCSTWRGVYPQHLEQSDCDKVEKSLRPCELLLRACENGGHGGHGSPLCAMAADTCIPNYMAIFQNATHSVYDRRRRHCPEPGVCYPDVADCQTYLNRPDIFDGELEVTKQTRGAVSKWNMMSYPTFDRYVASGDFAEPTTPLIRKLLDYARGPSAQSQRPFDVLIYVGVMDIICNPDGVLEALRSVDWEGKASFRGVPWEELPWKDSSGGRAGRVKAVPNLWLAEVEGAGHMAPYDQPVSVLKLVRRWLDHLEVQGTLDEGVRKGLLLDDDRGLEL